MDERAAASTTRTVYLSEYRPPPWLADTIALGFDLREEHTTVRARTTFRRNPEAAGDTTATLALDAEQLELVSVAMDGRSLAAGEYELGEESLQVHDVPERFELEVVTRIRPHLNTALEGLYRSSGNFCTQCEAEGFRRITAALDRPDVLARYTTTIEADAKTCPVLLSNGNLVDTRSLGGGRHAATWEDPFPKPTYLFALVAGDLACVEDTFVTRSGREVRLQVYVEHHNADKCSHAIESMKKAMRWDEEVYGREYDLERYMIVAVDDFNMGAMENKGLNIFNSKYVLASPDTATDADYQAIEGVIAHEYFHNWSGNRVTCRDWFQLSLKEGFTVFRDQEFSADTASRGVKRIEDVNLLRTHQFREDAGPMAHPVRPHSYQQINNFYTLTVYHKGAEVVRMIRNLLGPERFRRGTDLYFERHDAQAVTTDDFVRAMEDASGRDLGQFRRWYEQAGTPRLEVSTHHDPQQRRLRLEIAQSTPPTPGQPEKQPFHIPVSVGLLDRDGEEIPLRLEGEEQAAGTTRTLDVTGARQAFVFEDVARAPVPSVLCDFSAPVRVDLAQDDEELAFLMAHDNDPFNRWDAGQRLGLALIRRLMDDPGADVGRIVTDGFVDAFRRTLDSNWQDNAFLARALTLPSETYIGEFVEEVDPQAIHDARQKLRRHLAMRLHEPLLAAYRSHAVSGPYRPDPADVGHRALRNVCLDYLAEAGDEAVRTLVTTQFGEGGNMTDVLAALRVLANHDWPQRGPALEEFYDRWQAQPLVVDKWFGVQATSRLPNTFDTVRALTGHPAFTLRNPNRVRALLGAFAQANPVRFHSPDGKGYSLIAEHVLELDPLNPEVAARLAGSLSLWRRYEPARRAAMRAQLERIAARRTLSRHVREVVDKSLS